jgi:hypothetical protein
MVQERIITQKGVHVAENVATFLTIRSRLRRKRKAGERERCEHQRNRATRAVYRIL